LFQHEATPEPSLADVDRKIEAASAELAKLYKMREARLKEEEEAAIAQRGREEGPAGRA
jgi:hypothetical protein